MSDLIREARLWFAGASLFLWVITGTVLVLAATGLAPTIRADLAALWFTGAFVVAIRALLRLNKSLEDAKDKEAPHV